MPKISIITVTKNNLVGLKLSHASLFLQDFCDYEWIVIDGGSHDGSLEFLIQVQKTLPRTQIFSGSDSGIYQAMNRGIELSSSRYLLFLNAGDALADNRVLSEFTGQKFKATFIYGNCLVASSRSLRRFEFPAKLNLKFLLINYICHQATFMDRNAFVSLGNYDESFQFAGDHEFFIRAWTSKQFDYLYWPRVVACLDVGGISNKRENALKIQFERGRVIRRYLINLQHGILALRAFMYRLYRMKTNRQFAWASLLPLKFLFQDFLQLDIDFNRNKISIKSYFPLSRVGSKPS